MKLSIAVVDDCTSDRDGLARDLGATLDDFPQFEADIQTFESGEALTEVFSPGRFQLAFLDILMRGMTGIELAGRLRKTDPRLLIVFLTSSPEFAFDAFPVHPFDYLMKPYTPDDLRRVMDEAARALDRTERTVEIRAPYATYDLPISTILSAVSQGHVVEIKTSDGRTIRSLTTFAEVSRLLLPESCFMECNRGVLINMDHVSTLEHGNLRLTDGDVFALRTRNRRELTEQFTQYQLSRLKRG